MLINEINISSFGLFKGLRLVPGGGINIITGPNESGKSTLAAFLKFIFYGFPSERGASYSERTRGISWDGQTAAGSVSITAGGGEFRVERSVSLRSKSESGRENYAESCSIVDLATNTKVFRGQNPGELFFGVPAEIFDSTAFIRQVDSANAGAPGIDGAKVGRAVENIIFSADESVNTKKAIAKLEETRRHLLHKGGRGGLISDLTLERTLTEKRLDRAYKTNAEIIAREAALDQAKEKCAETKDRLARLRKLNDDWEAMTLLRRFEGLHALERKIAKEQAALERLQAEFAIEFPDAGSPDARFPDTRSPDAGSPAGIPLGRDYAEKLRSLAERLSGAWGESARREADLVRLDYAAPPGEGQFVYENIRTRGGSGAVWDDYSAMRQSRANFILFGVILTVLATIAFAGGFILNLLSSGIAAVVAGAGIFPAAIALVCFLYGRRKKRAAAEFCAGLGIDLAQFGVKNGRRSFEEYYRECEEENVRRERHETALAECRAAVTQAAGEAERLQIEAAAELAKIGINAGELDAAASDLYVNEEKNASQSGLSGGYAGLVSALTAAAGTIGSYAARTGEVAARLDKYRSSLEFASAELAGRDETELSSRLAGSDADELEGVNITSLRRELEFTAKAAEAMTGRRFEIEKQLVALESTAEDPAPFVKKLDDLDERIASLRLSHDACVLAAETIAEASESLRSAVAPRLCEYAGSILAEATDGKHTGLGVGGGLEMSFTGGGEIRSAEFLSGGTRDAAYIGLRFALIDLLYKKESPPVILDESLAYQDDGRAAALLRIIARAAKQSGGQYFILTCRAREAEIADGVCDYTEIKLGG